ncbi:MAG: glutaredoxin family protein [Pseudohongiellaceae bacterium]
MKNFDLEQKLTTALNDELPANPAFPKLALYITPLCPFCIYVRSVISSLGLDVEMRNTYERQYFDDLIAARNRATVPVLRINFPNEESWLPESMDIVKYLKELKEVVES